MIALEFAEQALVGSLTHSARPRLARLHRRG